jgi:arylsulfatase A-like enzyme
VDTVVLVSIDSLRADHVGIYGYDKPTSPAIDSIAESAIVFDRAYSTTSWTLPAHAALFTGQEDFTHGVLRATNRWPAQAVTLAEELARAGIRTTGFYSGPYLHPSFGLNDGFDQYLNCTSYPEWSATEDAFPHRASHADVTNGILRERIDSWASDADTSLRHFVFIHMWDVHFDYIAPKRYVDLFDPAYEGTMTGENFFRNPAIHKGMPERDLQHLLAQCDAEIRYTDDTLDATLDILSRNDILENAALIVLSDHGDEFLDHGKKGHRKTLYEEVVRIPLIIRILQDTRPTLRVNEIVSIIDLYPTICDLFGVECRYSGPAGTLAAYVDPDRDAIVRGDALLELASEKQGHLVGLVTKDGKVIRWERKGVTKYFDLREVSIDGPGRVIDPLEKRIMSRPVYGLVRALEARQKEAIEAGKSFHAGSVPSEAEIDSDIRERLRSLGYID